MNGPDPESTRPLSGVRILAIEQMQALPYATQLLARLGADVVKIEPITGDLGRGSLPAMEDPEGRRIGATFLRNNFHKRSVSVNLKDPAGRDLVLELARRFDVVAENSKAGAMDRLGLGYEDFRAVHPAVIYTSVSGFGNVGDSPYQSWPAFAPIVEAMSGIYDMKQVGDHPPAVSPVGALGDIGAALFATVGILSALRYRDMTGQGQYVDIAMLDSVMAMTDIVVNFWSMGLTKDRAAPLINHGFRAGDGWFIMQVGRENQFEKLARVVGHEDWVTDPRLSTRQGWLEHMEDLLRPAIEGWAADKSRVEVCTILGGQGVAAGPCLRDEELVSDRHVIARNRMSRIERPEGGEDVLVPGNPVKLSAVAERPDGRVPWLGEHTSSILADELGLEPDEIGRLREQGTVA